MEDTSIKLEDLNIILHPFLQDLKESAEDITHLTETYLITNSGYKLKEFKEIQQFKKAYTNLEIVFNKISSMYEDKMNTIIDSEKEGKVTEYEFINRNCEVFIIEDLEEIEEG